MESENEEAIPWSVWLRDKLKFIEGVGEYGVLLVNVIKAAVKKPPALALFLKQLYDVGVASLPVVSITGLFTGLVLAAQSFYQLADKGLTTLTGLLVAKAMITELGPVLTAFMVTGRVGAAMCAELGTMRVTEQVDALETMAVNPNRYLLAPRILAGTFIMPLLTIFSILMGILGGYVIAVYFFGMSPTGYFDPMPLHITMFDLLTGIVKAFVFGGIIMTISCYKGMKTSGGAAGVGSATTNSVVLSYCCILFTNFFLTLALNIFRSQLQKLL
ncbi:MAG TPA: ABC transporter permease [Rhabdochlamydiaceae bacterium]|nr:ABC transporter permease [Rhabdochlamydiaceae bacterium]